jgi:hypothetical protein
MEYYAAHGWHRLAEKKMASYLLTGKYYLARFTSSPPFVNTEAFSFSQYPVK